MFLFKLPWHPVLDGRLHPDLCWPVSHRDDDRQQQRRPLEPREAVGLRARGHQVHGGQQDELDGGTVDKDLQVNHQAYALKKRPFCLRPRRPKSRFSVPPVKLKISYK